VCRKGRRRKEREERGNSCRQGGSDPAWPAPRGALNRLACPCRRPAACRRPEGLRRCGRSGESDVLDRGSLGGGAGAVTGRPLRPARPRTHPAAPKIWRRRRGPLDLPPARPRAHCVAGVAACPKIRRARAPSTPKTLEAPARAARRRSRGRDRGLETRRPRALRPGTPRRQPSPPPAPAPARPSGRAPRAAPRVRRAPPRAAATAPRQPPRRARHDGRRRGPRGAAARPRRAGRRGGGCGRGGPRGGRRVVRMDRPARPPPQPLHRKGGRRARGRGAEGHLPAGLRRRPGPQGAVQGEAFLGARSVLRAAAERWQAGYERAAAAACGAACWTLCGRRGAASASRAALQACLYLRLTPPLPPSCPKTYPYVDLPTVLSTLWPKNVLWVYVKK
jgi:hypothetical protein